MTSLTKKEYTSASLLPSFLSFCGLESKLTHAQSNGNILVQTPDEMTSKRADTAIYGFIKSLMSSCKKLGFIPLVNNITKEYTEIVQLSQNSNELKTSQKYLPIYSHIPKLDEVTALLLGLEKVIEYRSSEIAKQDIIIICIDDSTIPDNMLGIFGSILTNGPSKGVYFIIKNKTQCNVDLTKIYQQNFF